MVDRYSLRFEQPSIGIENVNFKTARAKEFLTELSAEVSSFCQANTYELKLEGDPDDGYLTLPLLIPAMPHQFGLLAADFCTCLRSSLDYLVWQLALLKTKTPQRLTAFPVSERRYAVSRRF